MLPKYRKFYCPVEVLFTGSFIHQTFYWGQNRKMPSWRILAGDKDDRCINSLIRSIINYRMQSAKKGRGEDHTQKLAAYRERSRHWSKISIIIIRSLVSRASRPWRLLPQASSPTPFDWLSLLLKVARHLCPTSPKLWSPACCFWFCHSPHLIDDLDKPPPTCVTLLPTTSYHFRSWYPAPSHC